MEKAFLKETLAIGVGGTTREAIEPEHEELPVSTQCELLGKSWSWQYFRSRRNAYQLGKEGLPDKLAESMKAEIPADVRNVRYADPLSCWDKESATESSGIWTSY